MWKVKLHICLYFVLISKVPLGWDYIGHLSIIKQYCPRVRINILFTCFANNLTYLWWPLHTHCRRINEMLRLLLTEHIVLREIIKKYEHSLTQDCSAQWTDGFWALSEKFFINFVFPEEKKELMMIETADDWN